MLFAPKSHTIIRIIKIQKYLIANGNSTALVFDCPLDERAKTSNQLLADVEQVGFVENDLGATRLVMMGGELCINASIAAASLLKTGLTMSTSGLQSLVHTINQNDSTEISIALPYKREGNIIVFEGIGFVCENATEKSSIQPTKEMLRAYCGQYSVGAFGLIQYQDNTIKPYVYVKDVDSLVAETACGSGSIATSIVTGYEDIIQPTGESIHVRYKPGTDQVAISAHVQPLTD